MPITKIDDDGLDHVCAACGGARRLEICALKATSSGALAAGVSIELPACARCGSVELLLPRDPHSARASERRVRPHQLLVDLIATKCGVAEGSSELEEDLDEHFPGALELDLSDALDAAR